MTIKFEITLTNKWLYSLIFVSILLVLGVSVWAYNSGQIPEILGHSGEEIEVDLDGETQLLSDALNSMSSEISANLEGIESLNNALGNASASSIIFGEGENMDLSGNASYSVLISSTYFTCEDYRTYLRLDEEDVKSYEGAGTDSHGCDQNTIMASLSSVSGGSHIWSLSRGNQHSFVWIAREN